MTVLTWLRCVKKASIKVAVKAYMAPDSTRVHITVIYGLDCLPEGRTNTCLDTHQIRVAISVVTRIWVASDKDHVACSQLRISFTV